MFISRTARDTDWARSFAKALKERGVSVWFDEFDVQPGEYWPDALESGLRNSDVIVALFDADAPARPNLLFALNLRLRRYLVRDTPEQTAEELSATPLAA